MIFRYLSRHLIFKLASLFFVCGLLTAKAQGLTKAANAVVTTPHVRAELLVLAPEGIQVGKPLTVGLQIQHQPGWHTYWKNPGDSGLPTQLTWTLPAGIEAGTIAWPTPKKIPVAQLVNYGFEGQILLAVPLKVASTFQASSPDITVSLKAQWLVCKTECIPEEGEFTVRLPVRGSTAMSRSLFETAKLVTPEIHIGTASFAPQEKSLRLSVTGLPTAWQGKQLEAFPEDGELIETAAKQEQAWTGSVWSATIPLHAQRAISPGKTQWLVKIAGGQSNPARLVSASIEGAWPASLALKPATAPSPALTAALANNANEQTSPNLPTSWTSAAFWLAVAGALLGGLILNLMPCVLPILAIKMLSFAPQKTQSSSVSIAKIKIETTGDAVVESDHTLSLRSANALFALGVVGTFVLLGLLLLGLRSAGQTLGWGFQLQSPAMVMALAILFLFVGLNLFGAFEMRTLLPAVLANFKAHSPAAEAVASGVLAVLVATPCTAPFMGASLGLAITLPILQGLLIFAALGLGMALPFVAMAMIPQLGHWLLKALPKPGEWMNVLRRFLAWPIFATVIWLMWVYALQTSINSAFMAMLSLLLMLALVWALHLQTARLKWGLSALFALLLLGALLLPAALSTPAQVASDADWKPWSVQAQTIAKDAGQPVLVDFTAAWCITCQVNKAAVLTQPNVVAQFKNKKVLLLRADWTKPNAAIAAELHKLGRSGLPVYAFYLPGSKEPQLLPELLTAGTIESLLAAL